MIKRMSCLCAVLVVTLAAARPAEADYIGSFVAGSEYVLEVNTASRVAITILVITANGKLSVDDVLLFESTTPPQTRVFPRNSIRLIFKADSSVNGTGVVKITQGVTTRFEVPVNGHTEVVADVVPH